MKQFDIIMHSNYCGKPLEYYGYAYIFRLLVLTRGYYKLRDSLLTYTL